MTHPDDHSVGLSVDELIEQGAGLRDLHRALLSTWDADALAPAELRRYLAIAAEHHWNTGHFLAVRLCELFGDAQGRPFTVEHDDAYVLAMISDFHDRGTYQNGAWTTGGNAPALILRQDTELLDEVFWRIFEVEGGGEVSLANVDRFSRTDATWRSTILDLLSDGTIDRGRVIAEVTAGLNRDWSTYRVRWFRDMYTALELTDEEKAAQQGELLLALGSTVSQTVTFAVKELATLQKKGLLDSPGFLDSCGPALGGTKSAATTVLRMLDRISTDTGTDAGSDTGADPDSIAERIAEALANPSDDVQRKAATMLTSRGRDDLLVRDADLLSAVVAAEVLPDISTGPDVPATTAASSTTIARKQPEPLIPWTDEDAPQRLQAMFLGDPDPAEFECALTWLVAASDLTAVKKTWRKIRQVGERMFRWQPAPRFFATAFRDEASLAELREQHHWESTTLTGRLEEIVQVITDNDQAGDAASRVLLATPTDTSGVLAPGDFRARWATLQATRLTPLPEDLDLALHRVLPAHRAELEALAGARTSDTAAPDDDDYRHHARETLDSMLTWWVDCADTRPFTVTASGVLGHGLSWDVNRNVRAVLDRFELQPVPVTVDEAAALAYGLSDMRAEYRLMATDTLVVLLGDTLSVADAADGFAQAAPECTLTRWSRSFADATELSPVLIGDLLTALLPKLERKTRGMAQLLGVLAEVQARVQQSVTDEALRDWLSGFTGSSKATKSAKALLAEG